MKNLIRLAKLLTDVKLKLKIMQTIKWFLLLGIQAYFLQEGLTDEESNKIHDDFMDELEGGGYIKKKEAFNPEDGILAYELTDKGRVLIDEIKIQL